MTILDLVTQLEELAKAATPSLPSANWRDYAAWIGIGGNPACRIDEDRQSAFKDFIAALDPQTVLTLCAAIREQRDAVLEECAAWHDNEARFSNSTAKQRHLFCAKTFRKLKSPAGG